MSFVAFDERGFSVPAGRFNRGVLFAYGLQLQHLNPNSVQQMAAFEAMCEGVPRHRCALASVPVLLQVHLPEGGIPCGDDWLCQPLDEAKP
jgi:hypothetical protein